MMTYRNGERCQLKLMNEHEPQREAKAKYGEKTFQKRCVV